MRHGIPRETQQALEAAAAERDALLPQVEESKWRARQLQRERDTHATRAQELAQVQYMFCAFCVSCEQPWRLVVCLDCMYVCNDCMPSACVVTPQRLQAEASLSEEVAALRGRVALQEGSLQGELETARREAAAAKEALAATQQRLDDAVQEHENDRQELARLTAKRKTHNQVGE